MIRRPPRGSTPSALPCGSRLVDATELAVVPGCNALGVKADRHPLWRLGLEAGGGITLDGVDPLAVADGHLLRVFDDLVGVSDQLRLGLYLDAPELLILEPG